MNAALRGGLTKRVIAFPRSSRMNAVPKCAVHRRDREWQVNVDSSRPVSAISGHFVTVVGDT